MTDENCLDRWHTTISLFRKFTRLLLFILIVTGERERELLKTHGSLKVEHIMPYLTNVTKCKAAVERFLKTG